jgi:hypothetical protein
LGFGALGPGAAGASPEFAVGDASGAPGETVTVSVAISGNPGIAAFRLRLAYDAAKLAPSAISPAPALGAGTFASNIQPDSGARPAGDAAAVWFAASNFTGDGVLYSVSFSIDAQASGNIPLTLSYDAGDVVNQDYEDVSFALKSGSIAVLPLPAGNAPQPPSAEPPPPTAEPPLVAPPAPEAPIWTNPFSDVPEGAWFHDAVRYATGEGLMNGTGGGAFSPDIPMSRAMLVTVLHRLAGTDTAARGNSAFDDVQDGTWYTDAVIWASENGIASGVGDNRFAPDANITRQDLAVLLARYANTADIALPTTRAAPAFSDGADIAGYAQDAVALLYRAGIINGKDGNVFDPRGNATRAEAAAMLYRFAGTLS